LCSCTNAGAVSAARRDAQPEFVGFDAKLNVIP
jgi:hypothetical protein